MLIKIALAVLTLAGTSLTLLADASAARKQPFAQCMTDDGYGRFRPCDSLYKAQPPYWRATDDCMTDDGYGRYRPCDALYKQKHAK
jgi:hypothetical protein